MSEHGTRPGAGSRPPAGARKKSPPPGLATVEERRLGRYIKTTYTVHRSAFESLKAGVEVRWAPPAVYDGVVKPKVDVQDREREQKKTDAGVERNVWYRMARWFIRNNVDAVSFIQYVFARLDLDNRVPEPLQVCNEAHLKGYHQYITAGRVEIISNAFMAETQVAQSAFKKYMDMFGAIDPQRAVGKRWTVTANVILDRSEPLSALFRYLLALSSAKEAGEEGDEEAKLRFLDLARGLFDRAVVQFCAHKEAYLEHWKRWLPRTFAAKAQRRYDLVIHNEETGSEDEELDAEE